MAFNHAAEKMARVKRNKAVRRTSRREQRNISHEPLGGFDSCGRLQFHVSVQIDFNEVARLLNREQTHALMAGIAQVVIAQRGRDEPPVQEKEKG